MRWQISSSAWPARAARTSLAPCSAAARAVARPMPLEAPVMTMTCWSRGLRSTAMECLLGDSPDGGSATSLGREGAAKSGQGRGTSRHPLGRAMPHTRRRKRNKTVRFRDPLQETGMPALGFSRFRLILTGCALAVLAARAGSAAGGSIELASRLASPGLSDTAADSGRQDSAPAVSRDGRYVAFASTANNLVPGQVAHTADGSSARAVFLYDRIARVTTLVSHAEG